MPAFITVTQRGAVMRSWDEVVVFPKEKVGLMREIIQEKREFLKEKGLFFNTVLREDIFDLLNAGLLSVSAG